MANKIHLVPFHAFNGKVYKVPVTHFYDGYPRGTDGACAFCKADPLAEWSPEDSLIAKFHRDSEKAGYPHDTCPLCEGRPT